MAAAHTLIWPRREALQYTPCFRTTRLFTSIYSSEANMGVVTRQDQHEVSRIPLQNANTQLNGITCSAVLMCAFVPEVQTNNKYNNICRSCRNNVFSYSFYISFRFVRLFNASVFFPPQNLCAPFLQEKEAFIVIHCWCWSGSWVPMRFENWLCGRCLEANYYSINTVLTLPPPPEEIKNKQLC